MPEGDSVYQLSARMQFMTGREVTYTSLRVPRHATVSFSGSVCQRVWPYGKHLFMQFDELILHTHLKMEGIWAVHFAGDRWRKPAHSARVVLRLAHQPRDIEAVGHWLGFVDVYSAGDYWERIGHLGPDILAADWPETGRDEAISRVLANDPARPLSVALLDQRNLAGIGNEYRAELCFIAGTHPATSIGQILATEGPEGIARHIDIARKIMWANKDAPVRVTTGVRRAGETSYVFGRNHKPCRRCGTLIRSGELGDPVRIIWWCPHCQPRVLVP